MFVLTLLVRRTYGYEHEFLRSGHIEIILQMHNTSHFIAKITFKYVKGRRLMPSAAHPDLVMSVALMTQLKNLTMSLPHRLLVMALRRGSLRDHETIKSVLNGRELNIRILKPEDHVFLGLKHRSLRLVTEMPLPAKSISSYMSLRCLWLGYGGVSFYAW